MATIGFLLLLTSKDVDFVNKFFICLYLIRIYCTSGSRKLTKCGHNGLLFSELQKLNFRIFFLIQSAVVGVITFLN